ncbi:hypothetical protein LWI29_023336 [Acer saccharum]|uniref:Retrotransposon gag domain-containing protein n=1 Tax=Acer saccharum TaxID=4024 RepID=A0AA39VTL6_ACESA|nr:hypothetical protein LWI29_023336 [Acer saccharum]
MEAGIPELTKPFFQVHLEGLLLKSFLPLQLMTLAAAHLTGDTIPWYQWLERTIGNLCWPQFTRALSTRFGTLEEADPGGALSKLSQNGTVKDYQVQFKRLSNRTRGLPESFLISCFLSGLCE